MALISCPECGKEISDKAKQCIHCGMPMDEFNKTVTQLYKVIFKKFYNHNMYSKNRFKAFGFVERIYDNYEPQAKHINLNEEYMIFDGISENSAHLIKEYLKSKGCIIEIAISDLKALSDVDSKIPLIYAQYNAIKCPTCGSTNTQKISTTAKIAGAATFGLLSKTARSQFKCNHCGYKW